MTTISVKYFLNGSPEEVEIDSNVHLSILEDSNSNPPNQVFHSLHYLVPGTLPSSLTSSEFSNFTKSRYDEGLCSLNTIELVNDIFYAQNPSVAINLLYDSNHPDYDAEFRQSCRNDFYRSQEHLDKHAQAKKYLYNNIRFALTKHQELLAQGYVCYEVSPQSEDYLNRLHSSSHKFRIPKENSNLARSVMFYSRKNHVDTIGGIPVYSGFCKNFYDYMRSHIFNITDLENAPEIPYTPVANKHHIISHVPYRTQNAVRNKFSKLGYGSTTVRVGHAADISFANPKVIDMVEAMSPRARHYIIEVPGWKTALANQDITIQSYTKSQIQKRKLNLLPFLFKTTIRDENFQPKTIYQFSLHANDQIEIRSSRSIIRFADLIDLLADQNGLKFSNPEEVRRLAFQRVGVLGTYAPDFFSTLNDSALTALSSAINQKPLIGQPNNANFNDILKVPKIDEKISAKYKKIGQVITDSKEQYTKILDSVCSASRNLQDKYEEYKSYLRHLNQQKEEYEKALVNFQQINRVKDQYDFFNKTLPLHKQISSEYLSSFTSALENNNYINDDFFVNIEKEGILLRKLTFLVGHTTIQFSDTDPNLSENLATFLEAKNSNSLIRLIRCQLDIIHPQKIVIDANKSNIIYGGPYKIDFNMESNSTSIQIALLSLPALFGYNPNEQNAIYVHPHASSTSIQNPFSSARACLGEATTLLYNAAKIADIKTVIYSILIWVRSTNSADPWGRRYIYFPKENQCTFNAEQVSQKLELQDTEVVSFLEDTFSEAEDDPEEDLEDTEDPEPNVDNVVDFPGAVEENSQTFIPPTYNRYTPTQIV